MVSSPTFDSIPKETHWEKPRHTGLKREEKRSREATTFLEKMPYETSQTIPTVGPKWRRTVKLQSYASIKHPMSQSFFFVSPSKKHYMKACSTNGGDNLGWKSVSTVFQSRGPIFFNVLDEIVTWQRLQPPVAGLSNGFSGAMLGIRALSFVIVPSNMICHAGLSNIEKVSIFIWTSSLGWEVLELYDALSSIHHHLYGHIYSSIHYTESPQFINLNLCIVLICIVLTTQIHHLGEDPFGEAGLKTGFLNHSHLVQKANKLKLAMEQLLLKFSPKLQSPNNIHVRW